MRPNYFMQMLLPCFALLLAFSLAKSKTLSTTSKEEIKCNSCTRIPTMPPPPSPPSPPPPSPPPKPLPPPPACPSCPPCNGCEISNTPLPGPPRPLSLDQQAGMIGGAVYPPPDEVVPYFPYSFQNPPHSQSAASSTHLELKLLVSLTRLLVVFALSVIFS